jgi:transposase
MLDPKAASGRRVEVITGGGARRKWSDDEKARAIEDSLVPEAVVSEVARRHGVTPQQLFTWRREARRKAAVGAEASFVPAVVENPSAPECVSRAPPERKPSATPDLEIEIGAAHVWIWRGADVGMATAILRVLQTTSGAK